MIAVTGIFKEESVENKIVSAKELLDYLGVEIPDEEAVYFKSTQKKAPASPAITTTFEVSKDGNPLRIIYYNQKVGKKGEEKFLPRNYKLNSGNKRLNLPNQLEEFALLYLHPRCKQSPKQTAAGNRWYEYQNRKKEVEQEYKEVLATSQILSLILSENDEKVLAVAKGLEIKVPGGGRVNIPVGNIEISKEASVRVMAARTELQKVAVKYPKQVADALTDDRTYVRGAVQEAIDRSYIVSVALPGGSRMWQWKNGQQIVKSGPQEDAKVALVNFVLQPAGYESFFANYSQMRGVASHSEEMLTEAKTKEVGNMAEIKQAADARLIKYASDTGKVLIQKKDDPNSWRTLITLEPELDAWVIELNKVITPQTMGQIKSLLSNG